MGLVNAGFSLKFVEPLLSKLSCIERHFLAHHKSEEVNGHGTRNLM